MESAKRALSAMAGLLTVTAIIAFSLTLIQQNIPQSLAFWAMWSLLDTMMLISTYAAGNRRPWLALGFATGSTSVAAILLTKGGWHWTWVESVCLGSVFVSVLLWRILGPRSAVVTIAIAMLVAGIPQIKDLWLTPDASSWWLWMSITASSILTLLSARRFCIEECALPLSTLCYSLVALSLNLLAMSGPLF